MAFVKVYITCYLFCQGNIAIPDLNCYWAFKPPNILFQEGKDDGVGTKGRWSGSRPGGLKDVNIQVGIDRHLPASLSSGRYAVGNAFTEHVNDGLGTCSKKINDFESSCGLETRPLGKC